MTTGARTTALALVTVALGACTGASSTPTTNVADSAAVRIATNLPGSVESAPIHTRPARAVRSWSVRPSPRSSASTRPTGRSSGSCGGPITTARRPSVRSCPISTRGWTRSSHHGHRASGRCSGNSAAPSDCRSASPRITACGETGEVRVGEYPGQLGLMGISPEVRRMPARRWLVFDADGAVTAALRTPEGFQPHALREGRVWGVFTDEPDVESVRAYDVVKG